MKELEEQKKHEHDQIMKFVKRNRRIPGYRLIQIAEQYALMYQEDVRLAADEENFYLIYADGEVLQEE